MTVTPSGLHTVLVGLHEGMLTLAALSIIVIILASVVRKSSNQRLKNLSEKAIAFAEPTSVFGALFGSIILIVSAYVGMFITTSGFDSLPGSQLLMNKTMTAIFALEFWIIFLIIRVRYGKNLWNRNLLATVYAIIGLLGFLFTLETGSIGGTLAGKGSILDPLYDMTGIHPTSWFGLPAMAMYALAGVTILLGLIFAYSYMKSRRVNA